MLIGIISFTFLSISADDRVRFGSLVELMKEEGVLLFRVVAELETLFTFTPVGVVMFSKVPVIIESLRSQDSSRTISSRF